MFRAWEEEFPSEHQGEKENAWEDALLVPRGWLRSNEDTSFDSLFSHNNISLTDSRVPLTSVADEICAIGTWLVRSARHARTIHYQDLTQHEQKYVTIFSARYGVKGPKNVTLKAIGDQFGLTRERVRKIVGHMIDRAQGVVIDAPCFLQLQNTVATMSFISVEEFEIQHRKLLGDLLSLSDANRFALEILGDSIASINKKAFCVTDNAIKPMLGDERHVRISVEVRDSSRRMIKNCGAAHVMYVTGMVSETLAEAISVDEVRRALTAVKGMEWLTENRDWFWFGEDTMNNRALDIARKTLSVAQRRLDIEELHQAVSRSRRSYPENQSLPPAVGLPQHVLQELYARVSWLTVVQYNDFMLNVPIPMEDVLSKSELVVAKRIIQSGGAVARRTLITQCVETGLFSFPTLMVVLKSSPIIKNLGVGVYGLRGVDVSNQALFGPDQ
ncbi:MAG: hypothetical protein BACD_02606 [Bacteroides rodentium]